MEDYLEDFSLLEVLIDELHEHLEDGAEVQAHAVNEKIKSIYELP
jgi:hypothetical protein